MERCRLISESQFGILVTIVVTVAFVGMLSVMEEPAHYFNWQLLAIENNLSYDTKEVTMKAIDDKYCVTMIGLGSGWSGKSCSMPPSVSDLRNELRLDEWRSQFIGSGSKK